MICLTAFFLVVLFATKGGAVSILTVENHNFHQHTHDDGWGEWSWEPCSRTCGGGVSAMKRECLRAGPGACEGPSKMYTSCGIVDCPVHAQDFRSLQCSQYNNITYRGRSYEWIPYTGVAATNPCELFCQPKSGEFFLKMSDRVIDGTRCRYGNLDVCVEGECAAVGCDKLLGSKLKMDVCGECNGNGSSCYLVKRSVAAKLPSGYVPLILIPPGATRILVYEKKASKNFLAVRDSGKRYVLNGHWQINSSSVVRVAGSDLVYEKSSNRKKALENITITGPTSEMLYVDVLVQDRNRGIEYEFYLPQGMRDVNYGENGWFAEQWQLCSAECGGGIQKRKVVCKNNNSGERVLNYLCYTQERPQSARTCNTHSCGARWLVGEWEDCTQRCGGGVQIRQVNCVQVQGVTEGFPILLSNAECVDTPKPAAQRECGISACPEWTTGNWSECSVSCGDGVQVRNVACSTSDIPCNSIPRPVEQRSCNLGPCSGIDWVTSEWSECIGACGNGIQTREVACGTEDRVRYPAKLCVAAKRPSSFRLCESERLCPEAPLWIAEDWSECSVSCGPGIQTRRVVCGLYEVERYRILSDDDCSRRGSSIKPTTSQECLLQNCTESWFVGTWGPCSVSCGNGVHSRIVLCVDRNGDALDDESCEANSRPPNIDICNEVSCERASSDGRRLPTENCHGSTYGCCPDGSTKAQGENNLGCPGEEIPHVESAESPRVDAEGCLLEHDEGNCTHWTVYWYYDTQTGRCDRFWYGGCGGNANKFESNSECTRICNKFRIQSSRQRATTTATKIFIPDTVTPIITTLPTRTTITTTEVTTASSTPNPFDVGEEIQRPTLHHPPHLCFLRKSSGPCESRVRRWFFDGTTGRCVEFIYGGCGGNENNFDSDENCARICGNEKITFGSSVEDDLPNSPPVPVNIKPGRAEVQAQVGEMARLACMAEGSPKPTVTWHKVGHGVRGEIDRGEILEDHSLLISKITADDQGTYECTASNGYGPQKKWRVELIVKDRLLIREAPSDTTVHVGEPAALRCRIHDDVVSVTWYKDGAKVRTSSEYYVAQPWGDLHILQAQDGDSGVYTCTAYSSDASQSASATLTVSQKEQPATIPPLGRPVISSKVRRPFVKQCRDYPEYANCNVVVLKRMCHKHDFARYCCASCGGEPSSPPFYTRRRGTVRRRNTKR